MSREERLCRRAELAFGRALPAALGAPVIERAAASLALDDREVAPAVDWQVELERQAAIDRQGR
jgi:DNA-binding transcriptional regulator YdaS (Cro superfamily)